MTAPSKLRLPIGAIVAMLATAGLAAASGERQQPAIVAGVAALIAETYVPANTEIDPGERVTVNLSLRNTGTANTSNLVATLQATGGATSPGPPQNYGAVIAGGAAVTRSFRFKASGTCGNSPNIVLALQDGSTNLGTISYTLTLGHVAPPPTRTFANTASILIAGFGPAATYPSAITVSGLTGFGKLTVTLKQYNHTFPDDQDVLLVGPTGQKMLLMSDAGGSADAVEADITLDDDAAAGMADASGAVTGVYRPTNFGTGDTFPAPAPVGPYPSSATLMGTFGADDPNGTWQLYVFDDVGGDGGNFNGGWELTFTPTVLTFSNTTAIVIPGAGPAAPYPSGITVSGLSGSVKPRVTLRLFNHGFPDDVDVLLVGPTGEKMIVMSDVGGSTNTVNADIVLDDDAAALMPDVSVLAPGTYRPTNFGSSDPFPAPVGPYASPAPVGSATLTSTFGHLNANGTWNLFVFDDTDGDAGNFNLGWQLSFLQQTPVCVPPPVFTDDPLEVAVTFVEALHITELRQRVDTMRVHFGLAAFAWTDPLLSVGATVIRGVHVAELRTALGQAYFTAGLSAPGYTDPSLSGVVIKAVHLAQLRAAVIALE